MNKKSFQILKNSLSISFFIFLIVLTFYDRYELKNYTRYMVCTTIEYYVPHSRSGLNVRYIYTYNNKVYKDYTPSKGLDLNRRYFVKFSSKDHKNQKVIRLEVPEDFPEPPPEGWEKIPGKLFDKLYPEDVERIKKKYKIEVEGYN